MGGASRCARARVEGVWGGADLQGYLRVSLGPVRPPRSGDTTPCKVTPVILHEPRAGRPCRGTLLLRSRPPPMDHHMTLDSPAVGSWEGAVSYVRGTPVGDPPPMVQRSTHQDARQAQHPCKVMSSELMRGYELGAHARL